MPELPDRQTQLLSEYAEQLHSRMEEASRLATNEAEVRRHVEPVIEAAVRELYDLDFQHIRSERANASGRLDIAYGGVVVEFEHRMTPSRRREGAEQALDYLTAERDRLGAEAMFSAVVTDGREWGFLATDQGISATLELFDVALPEPQDRFIWRPNSVASCRRFLEIVGSHRQTPVTGESLVAAFGRGSPIAREVISRFVEAVQNRAPDDRIDTLYIEWRRSLEVAYGSLDDEDGRTLEEIRDAYGIAIVGSLGEFLFSLHTYFALIARVVAAETLALSVHEPDSLPSNWPSLSDDAFAEKLHRLEQGDVPQSLSISNLFEGDVFSWYLERVHGALSLLDALRRICAELSLFAFPRLAFGTTPTSDLLRELYQGLTTRELRKALGEFLTPNWLAQATLEAARRNGANVLAGRTLDCTCGTGTFLRPVLATRLQQLRLAHPEGPTAQQVQDVLNSVVGIDINPVAVVATRMNYLMALGDLAAVGDLYLPVWLADAVLLPSAPEVQGDIERPQLAGLRYVELPTSLDSPFLVPEEFLSQEAMAQLATVLRDVIGREVPGRPLTEQRLRDVTNEFVQRLETALGPNGESPVTEDPAAWENAVAVLRQLCAQLARLHAEGRNEVWAEIIENRFAPLFLGRFDLVVGNPPWLSWKKLPGPWKDRAEPLWRDYALWRVPAVPGVEALRSLQSSDVAVLVTAVALERYLRPGGFLAFVTPKGLINGDAANRAFRLYHFDSRRDRLARRRVDLSYRIAEILDFSEVRPFSPDAANTPVVIVVQAGESTTFPIVGQRWFRRPGQALEDGPWDHVRGHLRSEDVVWNPISTYDASPLAWWRDGETPLRRAPSRLTFGMGFNTRGALGVYHVALRGRTEPRSGLIRIANLPEGGRTQVPEHVGRVNAQLVIPVVRGQNIRPFSIVPDGYVLIPHDPNDRARPLTLEEMRSPEYRSTFDFFSNFREILLDRPPYQRFQLSETLWWHVGSVEQLGRDGTLLCMQEIASRPAAAVLRPIWDDELGRTVLPIPNHKVVFYRTTNEEEAYYLAGTINSSPVQDVLQRFANFTAISPQAIRYLPIPPFDSTDPAHSRIAALSRTAHETEGADREVVVRELNEIVMEALASEGRALRG